MSVVTERNVVFQVKADDGRTAFLEIVDGKLIRGGDLPTEEAAWLFMETLGDKASTLTEETVSRLRMPSNWNKSG